MSTTITAISQLLDALGRVPFIAGVLTKGTLLVLIAACLTRLLGRSPAAARHLVWSLAVGGLLLLPVMTLLPWRLELTTLAAARDAFAPAPPDPCRRRARRARAERRDRWHRRRRRRNAAATSRPARSTSAELQSPSPQSPVAQPPVADPPRC